MAYTLTQTINWAQTFIEYSPLTAGTGFEPALSIGTMVRNTILNAPLTWPWNRNEYAINAPNTPASLTAGTQDYLFNITDFAYLEKISLLSADGTYGFELKNCYNTNILGVPESMVSGQAQPNSAAVKYFTPGVSMALRFLSIPEQAYTGVITYQKLPIPFTSYAMDQVAILSGVAYYFFTSLQGQGANNYFAGQTFQVQGFDQAADNGTFVCTASSSTYLILANPAAVNDTHAATAINESWFPIPDHFMEIFNNLFLAEAMEAVDDTRGQYYRQRGIAALLSKAEGLSELQRNAFLAQWIARGTSQQLSAQMRTTQGNQARGV